MDELELIAAILAPRDLAPHPNFRSREHTNTASLLALLASARVSEYQAERGREEFQLLAATDPASVQLLDAVFEGLDIETIDQGATWLKEKATETGSSLSMRTVCALMGAVFLAELDRTDEAIATLRSLRVAIVEAALPGSDLLFGVLSQSLALRERDAGLEGTRPGLLHG